MCSGAPALLAVVQNSTGLLRRFFSIGGFETSSMRPLWISDCSWNWTRHHLQSGVVQPTRPPLHGTMFVLVLVTSSTSLPTAGASIMLSP